MHLMNWGLKPRSRKFIACMVALIMLLSMLGLGSPGTAQAKTEFSDPAESLVVNILNPDGSTTLVHDYSYEELEPLEEIEYYATIDAFPAPVGAKAKGVKIHKLIEDAQKYNPNIKWESGQRLVFYVTDAPTAYQPAYFTYDRLYGEERYYFPELVETFDPEYPEDISLEGAVRVDPMLSSSSYQDRWAKDADLKSTENPVTMDGEESFRFCMGITEEEAQSPSDNPDLSTTNKFARWVYRVDVAPLGSPRLRDDKTDNKVGQPIEIMFIDNSAWREKIAQVKVGENVLDPEQYVITAGKLTILPGVFTKAGTYTITVEANGFMNSAVEQKITEAEVPTLPAPPVLIADSSNNIVGQAVYITFTDDATWRDAITEIKVDDTILTNNQYGIGEGKITIAADAFPIAGTYIIVVKATGFQNATVQQIIDNVLTVLESIEITKPADKLIYSVGETLDITGLEVTGHYNNGSSRVEAITAANISGFDSSNAVESQTLTITIRDKIATYKVTICKPVTAADDGIITVTPDTPLIITVPEDVTNTGIGVSQNSPLPLVKIDTGQVDMTIASGTTVSGSDTIQLPEIMPASSVDVSIAGEVDLVIKVGSDSETITFSKPVRLVLKGQAKKSVGFLDNEGNFQEISKPASLDGFTSEGDVDAVDVVFKEEDIEEGAADCGKDLIIWTRHFTEFIAYTPWEFEIPLIIIPEIIEIIEFEEIIRTQTISSRGCIIKIPGAMINFPAGAVSEDVEVTIKKVGKDNIPLVRSTHRLLGSVYEFTTDKKVTFNKPVTITMYFDMDEVDSEKYDVGIYCWGNQEWVLLDQVQANLETGRVSGSVNHFSIFAVLLSKKGEIEINKEKEPAKEVVAPVKRSLKDISGHWAEANINKLANTGAIGGYPDGTFRPDNSITRAEFAAALLIAFKLEPRSGKVFSDTSGHWAQDSIKTVAAHGIVSGYDEANFGPDDLITREQMAVMISKAANLSGGEGKTFADSARISDWAKAAVAAASGQNIIGGYPDNTFRPQANATRAEAVTIIVKALN